MRAGFFGYVFSTVKLTSNQSTHNPGAYSYFSKLIMSHKRFFLFLGILIVAMLSACGKSEELAAESEAAGEMKSNVQAPDPASAAAPEATAKVRQTVEKEGNSPALSMADGLALAQKNNCLACHRMDTKLVGPAWKDVAKKYKGVDGAEHMLVIKVSTGAEGNWGNIPMPAMAPAVKEGDIRTLVKFVLSLDK